MESNVLATALSSREDYELLHKHLTPKRWSREFQIMFDFIGDYYARDKNAKAVDPAVLSEIVAGSVKNEKHVEGFLRILQEAAGTDVHAKNVLETVLVAKRNELAQSLAMAIANGKDHGDLLTEYNAVLYAESIEQAEEGSIETYTHDDLDRLLEEEADRTGLVPIMPRALNERLDGGMRGSDSMIIFARPEIGKTALILTIACGIAKAGFRVVIFNNEERIQRLYIRAISCLTALTSQEIRENIPRARDMAMERGFGNIVFIAMSPGSPAHIDAELEKYPDAKAFIVDQLRNLNIKSENRTNQLEMAARAIRDIGKRRNMVAIGVTQAGDSGDNKSVLDMGDVDNSNTGIPGACDVLLGVGADENQKQNGIRVMSMCKNKISGDHEAFPVRVNPLISKYISV